MIVDPATRKYRILSYLRNLVTDIAIALVIGGSFALLIVTLTFDCC